MGLKKNNPGCGCCGGCYPCSSSPSTIDLGVPSLSPYSSCTGIDCSGMAGTYTLDLDETSENSTCIYSGTFNPTITCFGSADVYFELALFFDQGTGNKYIQLLVEIAGGYAAGGWRLYNLSQSLANLGYVGWSPTSTITDTATPDDTDWISDRDCTAGLSLTTDDRLSFQKDNLFGPDTFHCEWPIGSVFTLN